VTDATLDWGYFWGVGIKIDPPKRVETGGKREKADSIRPRGLRKSSTPAGSPPTQER